MKMEPAKLRQSLPPESHSAIVILQELHIEQLPSLPLDLSHLETKPLALLWQRQESQSQKVLLRELSGQLLIAPWILDIDCRNSAFAACSVQLQYLAQVLHHQIFACQPAPTCQCLLHRQ